MATNQRIDPAGDYLSIRALREPVYGSPQVHIYGEVENDDVREELNKILKKRPWCRLVIGFARAEFFEDAGRDILVIREVSSKVRATSFLSFEAAPCMSVVRRATIRLDALAGLPFSCGVTSMVARAGAGKTPLLRQFAAAYTDAGRDNVFIPFGEPRGEYETDYNVLMLRIATALYEGKDVFIDSFKNPVYDLPGSASTGGASNALWTSLSDLSSIFDRVGLSFVALINPTTARKDIVENAIESLKTSSCGILTTESGGRWAGFVRELESGERLAISFFASRDRFEYEGSVAARAVDAAPIVKDRTEDNDARLVVDDVLVKVLSRLTK